MDTVQGSSFTIFATTIQNVTMACTVMRAADASNTKKSGRDAHLMKLVEEKQCAFSKPLSPHMEFAKRFYPCPRILSSFRCIKLIWLILIRVYSCTSKTLRKSADQGI